MAVSDTYTLGPYSGRPYKLGVAAFIVLASFLLLSFAWPVLPRFSVFILVSLVLSLWAVRRLERFVILFVVFLFFEGMIKYAYPVPVSYFFRDIILAVIYTVWLVKYLATRSIRGRYDKGASYAILAFVVYTVAVAFIPFSGEPLVHRLGGARFWLAHAPLFFIGADVFSCRRAFDRLAAVYLGASVLVAAYGVVQYFVGFEHLYSVSGFYKVIAGFSRWYGIDAAGPLRVRVFSTFSLPAGLAAAMQVACLVAAAYFIHSESRAKKALLLGAFVLCFSALSLTGTRSGYAPFAFAFAVFLFLDRERRRVLPVLAALVVSLIFVYVISEGVYFHRLTVIISDYNYTFWRVTADFERALYMVRDHPLGLGIATSAKLSRVFEDMGIIPTFYFIESGYGQCLLSLGWPGLGLLGISLLAVAFSTARGAFREGRVNWRGTLAFAFCSSMLFPMFVGMSLYSGVWPALYWLFAGAATAPRFHREATAGKDQPEYPERRVSKPGFEPFAGPVARARPRRG